MEGVDNNQPSQPESPGQKRWEAEEEAKEEQPQHEDEGSTSGVGGWTAREHK